MQKRKSNKKEQLVPKVLAKIKQKMQQIENHAVLKGTCKNN